MLVKKQLMEWKGTRKVSFKQNYLMLTHNFQRAMYLHVANTGRVSHKHKYLLSIIIKCGMHLIIMVGLISKWLPLWIYYNLRDTFLCTGLALRCAYHTINGSCKVERVG